MTLKDRVFGLGFRFFALFAWREVCHTGEWQYQENSMTGRRRAFRIGLGRQPRDEAWLRHEDQQAREQQTNCFR